MSRVRLRVAMLLAHIIPAIGGASSAESKHEFARVSVVKLSHTMTFRHRNVIIVPLEDCTVVIHGQSVALKRGDYKKLGSGEKLGLRSVVAASPRVALVEVVASLQSLTVTSHVLAPRQELEDASDRNQTLIIALGSLKLDDNHDLAPEGEPWKASHVTIIRLRQGDTAWLGPGMHRVGNAGSTAAKFFTIEW